MARDNARNPRQTDVAPRNYLEWLLLIENRGHLVANVLALISIGCLVFVLVNK